MEITRSQDWTKMIVGLNWTSDSGQILQKRDVQLYNSHVLKYASLNSAKCSNFLPDIFFAIQVARWGGIDHCILHCKRGPVLVEGTKFEQRFVFPSDPWTKCRTKSCGILQISNCIFKDMANVHTVKPKKIETSFPSLW